MIEIVLLLIVGFAILAPLRWRLKSRGAGAVPALFGRPGCRWKKDAFRKSNSFTRWVCLDCSVDAFTSDGKPPKECKRYARPTQL